ncbi:dUTP diphosphatase [Podarcis lilfordi]|uniref:dUTP diphosphatase n=1 Tax=Podarcis lilfordi TaxID=74358 RepID=A0AA35K227_9SAUR|nr:dUTP diphosphatase [Podarcis lilfordi]
MQESGKLHCGPTLGPGQLESFPPLVSAAANFSKNTPSEFAIDLINQETKDSVLPGEIVLMPTQLAGPLPPKVAGLILPKFSAAKEGIQVIPGVLDPDYVGTIMVQLWSHMPMQLKRVSLGRIWWCSFSSYCFYYGY